MIDFFIIKMIRLTVFLFLFSSIDLYAQQNMLAVNLNKKIFRYGDTIFLDIEYHKQNLNAASVFLVMINEQGHTWNFRWPLLKGEANVSLVINEDMATGKYQLYFAARDHFFRLKGEVKKPAGLKELKATLLAGSGDGIVSLLPVSPSGKFELNNLLFENEARILFSSKNIANDDLDISIITALDSSFHPAAILVKECWLEIKNNNPTVFFNTDSLFSDAYSLLPAVILYGDENAAEERLNKRYASGMFRDAREKIILVKNDPDARNVYSLLRYIRRKIPGLNILNRGTENLVSWRNEDVIFYLDEMKISVAEINSISIDDVVMIKAFPPPFFGNTAGRGGAIVIYTDRGENANRQARHNFTIQGYSPMFIQLPVIGSAY